MQRRLAVLCLLALGLTVVAGASTATVTSAGALGGSSDDTSAQVDGFALAQTQPDPDNTITRIQLRPDGTATWELTLRTRLATDADREEYERFQESFRANTSRYLDPFATRMTGVVSRANESHDREMRASNFTATTTIQEVPRRWGVVTFRFTWQGFAATDGDAVTVGDVFTGGFYIGEDDALEIAAPEGFAIEAVDPTPDERSDGVVEWRGREDFDDTRPRVVAAPAGDGATASDRTDGGIRRWLPLAGGVVVIGALLIGYTTRRRWLTLLGSDNDTPESPPSAGSRGMDPTPADETDEVGSGGNGVAPDADSAGTEPPILTDADRVRRALREHGGRMKQSAIVDELDWSKSKTSRVLSEMADDGSIEKLRIGRENVIDLVADD